MHTNSGGGRGENGLSAKADVEHECVGAFCEHPFSGREGVVDVSDRGRVDVRLEPLREGLYMCRRVSVVPDESAVGAVRY